MRIISKFKDYYDSVQALGTDTNSVYVRKEELAIFKRSNTFNKITAAKEDLKLSKIIYGDPSRYYSQNNYFISEEFIVGFCGKVYLGFKIHEVNNEKISEPKFFYDVESLCEYFEEVKRSKKAKELFYMKNWYPEAFPSLKEFQNLHAGLPYNVEYNELFHQFGTAIFVIPDASSQFLYEHKIKLRDEECVIFKNPCLKDLKFYKKLDSYSAYQQLQQFVSGVLTNTEQDGTNMTDIEKIKSHGFDKIYGFRKRPDKE